MTVHATVTITGHEARGNARIVEESGGSFVLVIDDYHVAPGLDPHIFLSLRVDDMLDDTAVDLGRVPTDVDRYRQILPSGIDLGAIRSIVVYCVPYRVLFGSGRLRQSIPSGVPPDGSI